MREHPGRGTALRTHVVATRFVADHTAGRKATSLDVVEVRKLLRTDMSLRQIALQLGVKPDALRNFIKRRNICNLMDRRYFISLQDSLEDRPSADDAGTDDVNAHQGDRS